VKGVIVYYGFLQIYFRNYALGGISQAWSLCTEVTFYLFLPLWAAFLAWVRRARRLDPRRTVRLELYGLGVLYLAGIASRTLLVYAVSRHWTNGEQWLSTLPPNLDLFALGMGLAVTSAWHTQRPVPSRAAEAAGRRPWVWWIAAAVAFWLVSTQCHLPRTLGPMDSTQYFWREVLYGLFALLLLVPGVFGSQDQGLIRRILRNRIVVALGVVSYGIYLWHQAVLAEFFKRRHIAPLHGHFKAMLAFTLVGAIVAATLSYLGLEKPLLRLKGKAR
jgi:peptidoglycan/LPS O-acetylase OafA/YrhL